MKQLGTSTWVLEGPTNIGFIEKDKQVILIDSGNDKESGRKINKILKEKNWTLKTVINTHSNADHMGGNDYLQRNLNCEIFSPAIEDSFISEPQLESAFLWGGLEIKSLRNKFFQAKPSRVTKIISAGDKLDMGLEVLGLPGHFMNMIGLRTEDDVCFLADSYFGRNILEKYKIPFIFNVARYKETLEKLTTLEASYFIPSHGPVEKNIQDSVAFNKEVVAKLEETLLNILVREKTFEVILKELCDDYGITLDAGQFALIGSTIKSFLTYLNDTGKADFRFHENSMYWSCK